MGTIYWSIFSLTLGGCIGSFLNVVIYRWPLGLSIRKPVRSFCPSCQNRIAWFDNIPVLSYVLLRGRCRRCSLPISLQYPLVESATALSFLMVYDAFFVGRLRLGLLELWLDWPILLAHWAMVAGLIVLTVMDLEAYMVDIRVTWLVSLAGIIGHGLWTPTTSYEWIRPGVMQSTWAWATTLGLAIGAWMLRTKDTEPVQEDLINDGSPPPAETEAPVIPVVPAWRWMWLALPAGLIATYVVMMVMQGSTGEPERKYTSFDGYLEKHIIFHSASCFRVGCGLLLLFIALTAAASHPRAEADAEIVEAIEFEAVDARRMALQELKLIAPAIILGSIVLAILSHRSGALDSVSPMLHWRAGRDWQPLWGLSTGLSGWVIGGAIGWLARIIFTILFGKEALGMGDVHILAAAGAVAGWPVALFGFFIAAILALLGLIVIRLRRQSRMLPYGPWLALGFFLAVMFQDAIFEYLNVRSLFES